MEFINEFNTILERDMSNVDQIEKCKLFFTFVILGVILGKNSYKFSYS